MFVMSMLDRLTDVKKSTYAKIIAVLVSVAMVLSLTNMSAFAEGDGLSGIFGGNSDVVKVAVDLDNAKIEYGDQTVTNADKTFVASAGKDLKFKASAVTEDFTLDEVALVTTAENGDEVVTNLEGIDGTYTIKADDVADGITIKASATEQKTAAKDSTVITDNQSGDGVTGTETTEPGTTDNGTAENGTPEEPSTETPAAGTPESTTPEGTPADTVAEPTTETPAGTTTPAAEPVQIEQSAEIAQSAVITTYAATMSLFGSTMAVSDDEIEPLANSNEYTLAVNDTKQLNGKGGTWSYSHSWVSSDSSIVSVSSNGSKAIVAANQAGTATITHKWYTGWHWAESHSETFTFKVVESTTTVYVYVKLSGDSTGWTQNKDGWFTIGKIELPSNVLDSADNHEQGYYSDLSVDYFNFDDIVRHANNKNIAIDFSKIDWKGNHNSQKFGLHTANGATDYSEEASETEWHLDGYLDVTQKYNANIEYLYATPEANGIENKAPLPEAIARTQVTSGTEIVFPVPVISGFDTEIKLNGESVDASEDLKQDPSNLNNYIVRVLNQDVKVEVIYHPVPYTYTINYFIDGTTTPVPGITPNPIIGTAYINKDVVIAHPEATGYKVKENQPNNLIVDVNAENNTKTVYYVIDENQQNALSATVDYILGDEEQEADHMDLSANVQVLAEQVVPTTGVTEKTYTGWKLEGIYVNNEKVESLPAGVADDSAIEYRYVIDENQIQSTSYTIHYFLDDVEQTNDVVTVNSTAWVNDNPAQIAIAEGGIAAPADKYANYTPHAVKNAEQNWPEAGDMVQSGSAYNVYYVTDRVSTDPTNPGNPDPNEPGNGDGIPDMYQARVNFVAVNGSVNIPYTYVTLLDENGQPSENGTGYLTAEQIAVATAAEGYDQDSLAWDVVPTTENAITGEVTYTATFTANQPVVPADPGTPGTTPTPAPAGPVPGAAPAALAPVAAALAAPVAALIGDEPTPLAEEAIGDEEDPLAAFDHVNCWVHYYMILGILLTLVYGGCVIARRSNYSRKIQKMDNYATGKAMDTVEETENVANAAAQKMEA